MKLVENGLHSFEKSILLLREVNVTEPDYEYKVKDIILSFHHAIETLMKCIIREVNELLVYDDIEGICEEMILNKFKSTPKYKTRNTIKFMDAVHRAISLKNIDITETEYNCIKYLNEYRNSITHYEVEFSTREVEHLIAKLLPVFYRIFSEYVKEFGPFISRNNLNTNMKAITGEYSIWAFKTGFSLYEKVNAAKKVIEDLNKDPTKIRTKMDEIRKIKSAKSKLHFDETCPICKKESFLRTGTIIGSAEERLFFGECKYCEIVITEEEASFVTHNCTQYDNFGIKTLEKILDDILSDKENLAKKVNKEDLKTIQNIYYRNKEVINECVIDILSWVIDEVIEDEAGLYFYGSKFDNVDCGEEMARNGTDFVRIEYEIEELNDENLRTIAVYVDNFNSLSGGDFKILNEKLEVETAVEFSMQYPNPHTDEIIDGIVEINVLFKFDNSMFEQYFTISDFEEYFNEH